MEPIIALPMSPPKVSFSTKCFEALIFADASGKRLQNRGAKQGGAVESKQATIGARVRVANPVRNPGLDRGRVGTINGRWGHPEYLALDVLLEDGTLQLFWHHELEEIAERT
jgi:hypothetical protein